MSRKKCLTDTSFKRQDTAASQQQKKTENLTLSRLIPQKHAC